MDAENIDYKEVPQQHLGEDFLQDFNRFQETHRVWFLDGDVIHLKDDHFIENWDEKKKESVIQSLRLCLMNGGIVIGVFRERTLIGFASIEGEFFGRKKQYLELSYIHVSHDFRHCGIGKRLFEKCCKKAKQAGAEKLYIAAHPSEETQQFYRSAGCILAEEINEEIYQKEPLDPQLERRL